MTTKIALCADTECLEDPSVLGLTGEKLFDQSWIVPFADALIARKYLREHAVSETWVVSSDSIDGINLAAALKKDNQDNDVRLFLPSPSGSKLSRCQNAGVIPICGKREFMHLYTARKLDSVSELMPTSANTVRIGTLDPVRESKQRSANVTVKRIEREKTGPTGPLPLIEIEEAPLCDTERITNDDASIPQRKSFTSDKEEEPDKTTDSTPKERICVLDRPTASLDEGATVVTVVSGSGGTGKSSVSALVALLAQKRGIRTLVLDADFQFGDLKYLLGYKHALDTRDLLEHPEQIDTLLKVDTWPALLAAPAELEYSEIMEERIGELLAYLKPHFDLIVVNTGAYWSELQLKLLEASNNVFFLVDQRPSSVRACNHALDLCARCGIATTSFTYLLNFCSKRSLLSSLDVSCALKGAKVYEIKNGGGEVGELLGAGMAHKLSRINNGFCTSIEQLLAETVYDRIKPSLPPESDAAGEKAPSNASRSKHRSRQKRRAACL